VTPRGAALLGGALLALAAATAGTGYRAAPLPDAAGASLVADAAGAPKLRRREESRRRAVLAELSRRRPRGIHVVIDQTHNRLCLKRGRELLREAVCSAGSGLVLREHGGKRTWIFDTPRGMFRIHRKVEDPVWTKPDWAFVEEGRPIPSNAWERVETGTLGDYACYFGDSYLIHGTLYTRLLGRNVSHGCIRLGDEDLSAVYHAVSIGTPVYIY
jgi:L,D-transpeptidase YbiS